MIHRALGLTTDAFLLLQHQVFMHGWTTIAPHPRGFHGWTVARFVVPFKLIAQLWTQ